MGRPRKTKPNKVRQYDPEKIARRKNRTLRRRELAAIKAPAPRMH